MSHVYRKCFVCNVEIEKAYFLVPHESLFMLRQILEIPNWTNDLQRIKFEKVCYCLECLNRILKTCDMIKELNKLEKDILQEKDHINSKLMETCIESERNPSIGEDGQQKSPGMLQILRHEIVTKLGKNSSKSKLGKIQRKDETQKYHLPLSEISTLERETLGHKKLRTNPYDMESLISNELPRSKSHVKTSATLPVSHQTSYSKEKIEIQRSKSKCLNLDLSKLNRTEIISEVALPNLEPDFILKDNKTLQIRPIKQECNLQSTARKTIDFKKSSKYNNVKKNMSKNYTKPHGKSNTNKSETVSTSKFDNGKDVSRNLKTCGLKQRKSEIKNAVNPKFLKRNLKRTLSYSSRVPAKLPRKCQKCRIVLSSTFSWNNHMMSIHDAEPKYKCTICSYGTGYSSHLMRHMTKHFDENDFKCYKCSKAFKSNENLDCHMKIHSGKFQCKVCLSKFNYSSSLVRHKNEAHGEGKDFKCDLCFKNLKTKLCLLRHRKVHGGNFQCKVCLSTYHHKTTLRLHEIEAHERGGDEIDLYK